MSLEHNEQINNVPRSKRVYICADRRFPHGDAGGNRIEYMAHCMQSKGIQPVVISMSEDSAEYNGKLFLEYQGILYHNVVLKCGKIGITQQYFYLGIQVGRVLKAADVAEGSVVIIYSSNPVFCSQVRKYIPARCKLVYDVVEWFDDSCYKYGKLDPRFWVFQWCFNAVYPKSHGIIAISNNIEQYFLSLRKNVFRFPICLDVDKFSHVERTLLRDRVRLIYPGNPQNKDDIRTMINAIRQLDQKELEQIELHFTAVKKKTIECLLEEDFGILLELGNHVVFHDWMTYEELLRLYGSVDVLYMLRLDNLVTKSNFPSKVPELLSCGVAVMSNDIGDFFKYLSDGVDAIKIESRDVSGCVDALRRYLNMDEKARKQMSEAAIRCAKAKFNYTGYAQELVDYLGNL